ncbi:hypothetical protein PHBOTO_005090, partial [Pseudozyma hubeiensis]
VEGGILEHVLSELGGQAQGECREASFIDDAVDIYTDTRTSSPNGHATRSIIETPPSTPAIIPSSQRDPRAADSDTRRKTPKLKHFFRRQKNDWTAHIKEANTLDDLLASHGMSISSDSQQSIIDLREIEPTARCSDRVSARSYQENAEAYVQALRDARNAQSRACRKRQSLGKQGLPFTHIVSPRLRDLLEERGIPNPIKRPRFEIGQPPPSMRRNIQAPTKVNILQTTTSQMQFHDDANHSQRQGLTPIFRDRKTQASASSSSDRDNISPSDQLQDHPSMLDDDDHSSAHSSSASDSDCEMGTSGPRRVQEETQARMNASNSSRKRKRASTDTRSSTFAKLRRPNLPPTPSPTPTEDVSPTSPPCGQPWPENFPSSTPPPTPSPSIACTLGSVDVKAIDSAVAAAHTRLSQSQGRSERVTGHFDLDMPDENEWKRTTDRILKCAEDVSEAVRRTMEMLERMGSQTRR